MTSLKAESIATARALPPRIVPSAYLSDDKLKKGLDYVDRT